jgi:hypothetical protein
VSKLMPGLDSPRNPFEIFLLTFGLVVAAPLLCGAPAPGSTTELVGRTAVHVWAWMLGGGCFVALTGAWWTWWRWAARWVARFWPRFWPDIATALLIEQVGLVATGAGCGIYVIGLLRAVHGEAAVDPHRATSAVISAGIVAGFAVACWWRAVLIQLWVNATLRRKQDTQETG